MKNYEAKYEPKSLSDIVVHAANKDTMPQFTAIALGETNQNIILFGANGTGKTILAKVLTSEFYRHFEEENNTHFVQMAFEKDNKNYEKDRLVFHWSKSGISWHILDEIDKCLHKNVYNELHHTLDNKHGHRYIMTANTLVNVPAGILSRAQPIPVDCPTADEFLPRAVQILENEQIKVSKSKILSVLNAANRDLRSYYRALERI